MSSAMTWKGLPAMMSSITPRRRLRMPVGATVASEGVAEAEPSVGIADTEPSVGVADTEPSVGVAEGVTPEGAPLEGAADPSVGAAPPVGSADGAPGATGTPEGPLTGTTDRGTPGKEKVGGTPVADGKSPPNREARSPPPCADGAPLADGNRPPRSDARSPPVEPVGVPSVGAPGANMLRSPSKPLGLPVLGVGEPVGTALLVGELGANKPRRLFRPLGLLGIGVPEAPGAATLTLLDVLPSEGDCPLVPEMSDTRVDTGPETGHDELKITS
ncbi:hypothetical protein PHLGIDRAFT_233456 [Phlebiopsis gigantea 11061_1 CR5-6]|uniref:Uncharacterized protein n=1 Tax=Phlebiopsis gigantea (strain 11061_1 CR5-6) TaxID=745531 RepID=A0A0C3PE04_PHLG1|nr:hypothetical protein PHLGIDRAFT_233456 [Phlebiopsis gigantea 11061_1 CR5-6]